MSCDLKDITMKDFLNAMVHRASNENPTEYFDKVYASINPIMMMAALDSARDIIEAENLTSSKTKKPKEEAEVYITLGGESMNQSLYTGIIGALLWLPRYLRDAAPKFGVDQRSVDIALDVLNKCALPQIHDVKEEVIKGEKVRIEPSSIRHYTAFLAAIVSWLNDGVNAFSVKGIAKTNLELVRYLSAAAVDSFPAIPFGCYHVGTCKTTDITKLTETLGKSFDWLKYMTDESYTINQPQFVITTTNAPVVSIIGHPLTETFAVKTEEGVSKWLGIFIETEEFAKMCANAGFTTDQLKKYIITTSPNEHSKKLQQHDPIATFINKQKMTQEMFKLRHKFSSVKLDTEGDEYDA